MAFRIITGYTWCESYLLFTCHGMLAPLEASSCTGTEAVTDEVSQTRECNKTLSVILQQHPGLVERETMWKR